MKVCVGTANWMKVEAVRSVFRRFMGVDEVEPVNVRVSVPSQPVGIRELMQGALERALGCMEHVSDAQYGVGVEAGLIEFYSTTGFLETQLAVIMSRDSRISVGLSSSFELPPHIVNAMLNRLELGEASGIARGSRDIGEYVGYIGVKTWGYLTRFELTVQAVISALVPWIEGGTWLMRVDDLVKSIGLKLPGRTPPDR